MRFDIYQISTLRLLAQDVSEQGARQIELNGVAGVEPGDCLAVEMGAGPGAAEMWREVMREDRGGEA